MTLRVFGHTGQGPELEKEPRSKGCSPIPEGGVELLTYYCSAGALQHGSLADEAQLPPRNTLADRGSALRYWEEHCFDGSGLQENRRLLRQHYHEAKHLGNQVTRPCILLSLSASPAGSKPAAAGSFVILAWLRCVEDGSTVLILILMVRQS